MISFYRWCKENEVRDPFEIQAQLYQELVPIKRESDGTLVCNIDEKNDPENDSRMPSELEIHLYCLLRGMFYIDKELKTQSSQNIEKIVRTIGNDKILMEYLNSKIPCDYCLGQCSLFCKYYGG